MIESQRALLWSKLCGKTIKSVKHDRCDTRTIRFTDGTILDLEASVINSFGLSGIFEDVSTDGLELLREAKNVVSKWHGDGLTDRDINDLMAAILI